MVDFKEIPSGEIWELFARDFLTQLGFFIESSPDRGADAGKDMIISEELTGALGRYRLRWLVSCKHNAISGKSVNEDDEKNILERVESFDAQGFIGFYSTIPSSALNSRLKQLRDGGKIKDYRIFDHKLIENYLIQIGFSILLMRYLPQSYRVIKPLHLVNPEYVPLKCRRCGKDLLETLYQEQYLGLIGFVESERDDYSKPRVIEDVYWACKDGCDELISDHYLQTEGKLTGWEDIGDIAIPAFFLEFIFRIMKDIRNESCVFTDNAYGQLKEFLVAISQKVLRETTPLEKERIGKLMDFDFL